MPANVADKLLGEMGPGIEVAEIAHDGGPHKVARRVGFGRVIDSVEGVSEGGESLRDVAREFEELLMDERGRGRRRRRRLSGL